VKLAWTTVGIALALALVGCAQPPARNAALSYAAELPPGEEPGEGKPADGSAPELGKDPSLDDYLIYAMRRSERLRAAFYRWRAALARVPQAEALSDPQFTYTFYIDEVETRVGPQEQAFMISQMFPWFGKLRLRGEVAFEEAETQRLLFEKEKLRLVEDVKNVYYELYHLARAVAITEENLRLLRYLEEVVRRRFEAARGGTRDLLKVQVELGKISDELRTLQEVRPALVAKLNALLNRPKDAPIPDPGEVETQVLGLSEEELWQRAVKDNPGLLALDHQVRKGSKGVDLARTDYFPNLMVGVRFIDTEEGPLPFSDVGKDAVLLNLSVNVPIWFAKLRGKVTEAKSRLFAAQRSRSQAELDLGSQFKLTLYRMDDARRKISLYRDALIPKAEQSMQSAEADYIAGRSDFLTLIDAQRLLLLFQRSYYRAVADYEQHRAHLETLVGGRIALARPPQIGLELEEPGPAAPGQ